MKKQIYTHILTRTTLRLLLLLLLTAGVNEAMGQERRYWDFTNWSDATVANLKADAAASESEGWSDVERLENNTTGEASKDNCFWAVTTPDDNGELRANNVVIEELKGLKFGQNVDNRGLAIAVNYPSTSLGTYKGSSYLWLGGSNKQFFTIPNVAAGSIIKMGVESHKTKEGEADARGVELYIGDIKINGPEVPTTYEVQTWLVPDEGETVDIVVNNTNGCHIYFIEVTDKAPEEIVVGETQVWFRNNEFANKIGDLGNGHFTYASSNPNIIAFETGKTTGIATIKGVGTAIVTATKNGSLQGSYSVRVKKDTWDISESTDGLTFPEGTWTTGLYNGGTALHMNSVPASVQFPAIGGQTFSLIAGKTGDGTYNHNIYVNNIYGLSATNGQAVYEDTGGFRIANRNTDNTYTATAKAGIDNIVISIPESESLATNGTYIKSIKTYFPNNTISFTNSGDYIVSYLPNSQQAGLLATTNNSYYNVYYESQNTNVATVHPFTGDVTVMEGSASETVTIRAYNLGEIGKYNGNKSVYAEYTLRIGALDELSTDIRIEDLLYKDAVIAAGGALNRTIPYFNIIVEGGDLGQAAQSDGTDGLWLKYVNGATGKLTIQPRYDKTKTERIDFSNITITFAKAPTAGELLRINDNTYSLTGELSQEFAIAGQDITIEYGSYGDGVVVSSVHVDGKTSNNSAISDFIESEKTEPTIEYDLTNAEYSLPVGSRLPVDALTSSCNFRSVMYLLTDNADGAFSIENGYIYAKKVGTAILNATFDETKNYAAIDKSKVRTWTLIAVEEDNRQVKLDILNKIKVAPTPTIEGFAFCNTKLEPALTINEEKIGQDRYNIIYTTNNTRLAYVDDTGDLMTYPGSEGLVTITATITPKETETNVILTASFNLMVLSGEWDFSQYNTTYQNKLKSSTSYSDSDAWSLPDNNNGKARVRDTEKFEYILQGGNQENEPLEIARALQSRYSVRWMREDGDKDNYFHLFGSYNVKNKSGYGGILKVPVEEGMIIQIDAFSDGEDAEMLINNDGNPLHTSTGAYSAVEDLEGTPTTYFYLGTDINKSYRFIVTKTDKNGFIYIINPSYNLYFYIKRIKLSREIVFKYEKETYIDGTITSGGQDLTFNNPILNGNDSKFEYEIVNNSDGLCQSVDQENGTVTLSSDFYTQPKYGSFTIKVTGTDGDLADATDNYTVHAIDMNVKSETVNTGEADWTTERLKALITRISYGPQGENLPETVKDNVEFSVIDSTLTIRKVSLTGEIGNQILSIEGIGTVKIQAQLGSVVRTIEITVTGVALSDYSLVCPNSETSIEFTINATKPDGLVLTNIKDDVEFDEGDDKDWMLGNLLGDIEDIKEQLQLKKEGNKLILSRKDGQSFGVGGAMPIRVRYTYGGKAGELTGMITIAYSKHTWNFESNMLLYGHSTFDGIYDFYTSIYGANKKRMGEWTSTATFDEPVDAGTRSDKNSWRFLRKIANDTNTPIIYYYNHPVDGDNAKILPETTGLLISSSPVGEQFGVQMEAVTIEREDNKKVMEPKLVNIDGEDSYDMRYLMLRQGGELIIPCVKPGQWIEMRWYRHTEDRGERMKLTNLYDVEGKNITETYRIGNTDKGTYMFQVDPTSSEKWLNAVFHINDPIHLRIYEVELHEPGWKYESSMNETLQQIIKEEIIDGKIVQTTEPIKNQLTDVEKTFRLANRGVQNAPNGPSDWQFRAVGNITFDVIEGKRNFHYSEDSERYNPEDLKTWYYADVDSKKEIPNPKIAIKGSWGKLYVTLNTYTTDYVYVANRKTWVITFGEAPAQEYPYTWDFTKYFENTKEKIGMGKYDDVFKEDSVYASQKDFNSYGSHEYRIELNTWDETGDEEEVVTEGYNTANYGSFFVNGAQLVGYGLLGDKKYNGRLPETAGLGFILNNLDDENNDGRLSLDMQSYYAKAVEAGNNETWRKGKLSIRGGSIIVPRPIVNDKESTKKAEDFYIYVRSSKEPTKTHNTDLESYEKIAEELYKYRFAAADKVDNDIESGNVVLEFDDETDVCAIAVTNKFKTMTALSGTGWATESRDSVIDHTLTRYLTTNRTEAYAIVERYDNPTYSDNKAQTVVALKDRRYVVPASYGLVMKQTENVPQPAKSENTGEGNDTGTDKTTEKATYQVPLFVPAVTTAVDNLDKEEFNLMRPNVEETELKDETEKVSDPNAMDTDYTRFILASRYMTWKRQDGKLTTTEFESGDVAAFYRLHVYSDEEAEKSKKTTTELNTLKANTAYLLLRSSKINEALWNSSNGARQYIGIQGVSDMYDDANDPGTGAAPAEAQGIYNLSGQKLNPGGELAPGVYIINGKKIIIRRNNGK